MFFGTLLIYFQMPDHLSYLADIYLVVLWQVSIDLFVESDHPAVRGHAQAEALGTAF